MLKYSLASRIYDFDYAEFHFLQLPRQDSKQGQV